MWAYRIIPSASASLGQPADPKLEIPGGGTQRGTHLVEHICYNV